MRLPEKWIWLPKDKYPQFQTTVYSGFNDKKNGNYTVAEFKKTYFFDKEIASAKLRFSADTSLQLYCNDKFTATGPASVGGDFAFNDNPRPNYYSTQTVIFPKSKSLSFFARVKMMPTRICEYSKGHGGFMLAGLVIFTDGTKTIITTDKTWQVRKNNAYTDVKAYDGTILPDEYVFADEIDNIWHTENAPIPPLSEHIITPNNNTISLNPGEEKNVTLYLDKIYGGYLNVSAKTSGIVKTEILCREKDSGGISENIVFAGNDEYRGFVFHSAGEIHVKASNRSDSASEITINFIFTHYPTEITAKTVTNDEQLNEVLDICKHTLKICRQTHHLDSTTHCEPLACTGDYYIESLMTAFSFGDMRLAEFDIMRTAELLRGNDGVMFHTSYSLIWVLMLYDVYMFTGNIQLLHNCEDALIILLNKFDEYIGSNGLIESPPSYMFIDWIYIDGLSMHHPPKALGQTCLSMFLFGALDTAEKIFSIISEAAMAEKCSRKKKKLKNAINDLLYDKERELYFEGLNTKTSEKLINQYMPQNTDKRYYLKHANILAAYFGICDKTTARKLIHKIMNGECPGEYQPYFAHYLLEAIYRNGLRDTYTLAEIEKWKKPVLEFPKGLIEGFIKPEPGYGFDHSHAWGGTPLYSLPKAIIGLEIIKPGFKEISLSPSLLGLKSAKVELPTPYGMVTCEMCDNHFPVIEYPSKITVRVHNPS